MEREKIGFYDDEHGEYFRDMFGDKIRPINGVYPKLFFQFPALGDRIILSELFEEISLEKDEEELRKKKELFEKLHCEMLEKHLNRFREKKKQKEKDLKHVEKKCDRVKKEK